MKLSDFDYNLPKELIAQHPLKERDAARLLVVNRLNRDLNQDIFSNILEYLRPGDLLVLNDTKVVKCRLFGRRKSGGKVEVFLLKQEKGPVFEALLRPGRLKEKEEIFFNEGALSAKIVGKNKISFSSSDLELIRKYAVIPLPPYIKRPACETDDLDYQTVYSKIEGAVASPTAGLHFTTGLLEKIKKNGVQVAFVTLHVGWGTFKPVKDEDIMCHRMEAEDFFISKDAEEKIIRTKNNGGRVIAVGTTACRVLESFAEGKASGSTEIFIYPGYKFRFTDALITNFHLPRTTLLMLVSAFGGMELMREAYKKAIDEKYRFYSYGDAMFLT